ncbi:MAG: amidophosphoribosyltransferase [Candidatus Gracilibacteria bacterium]
MCGILGIYAHELVTQELYDGLLMLQHRGQDAAGMIIYDGAHFHTRKELGLVKDIFHTRHMKHLLGYAGIAHVRYSTIGGGVVEDAQPFLGQAPFGVALGHNGNIFNSHELKKELFEKDHRLVNSNCDAEVILHLFTKALTRQDPDEIKPEHIFNAAQSVAERAKGSYSTVGYIARQGMVAFRDPHGIRPLIFGKRDNGRTVDYIFSSESVALDVLGFEVVRDVGPGEVIFIDEKTRTVHSKTISHKKHFPCIFEYVYFARPDSVIDKVSVYKSRRRMGENLANKIKKANLDIDVVMPVPDSSRTAALALASELGIKYREGLVKNRYIGRTFIMPGQAMRKQSIRHKLNPMKLEIQGKKVLLVDDSIVRGNTSREIVQMVRDAGATKVYFVSYSPPVTNPCLYGIDTPTKEELIASSNSIEEMKQFIGADELIFQDFKDMESACLEGNHDLKEFCTACFDGNYKTGDVTAADLKRASDDRTSEKISGGCEPMGSEGELHKVNEKQMNLL